MRSNKYRAKRSHASLAGTARGRSAVIQAASHVVERLEDRRLFTTYLGAAAQAASATPLGINIGASDSYSTDALFFDVRKDMDAWRLNGSGYPYLTNSGSTPQLTSTGYPLVGAYTETNMFGYPSGIYTLVYSSTGTANITVASMGTVDGTPTTTTAVVGGITVTTTTEQVQVQAVANDDRLLLYANNVDANDLISNLHFYMPGYVASQTPPELNPNVAARLGPFGTVRLMALFDTNATTVTDWTQRTTPADFDYTGSAGIAYEDAIAMANQLQENLWWNVPVGVNTTFMTDLADLIKYGSDGVTPYTGPAGNATSTNPYPVPASGAVYPGLNSNLKVYIEYGNELWHTGFTAETSNIDNGYTDAQAGNIPGASLANQPAGSDWFGSSTNGGEFAFAAEEDIYYLHQLYSAFYSVYGSSLATNTGTTPPISFVLEADDSSSLFTQAALLYANDMSSQWNAPSSWISDYAVPTYIALDSSFSTTGLTTQTQYLNAIFSDLDAQVTSTSNSQSAFATTVATDAQFTSTNNFTLVSYEGGQSLIPDDPNNTALNSAENAAQDDPRMGQFYTQLLNDWYSSGGSLLLPFDFAETRNPSGDWGLLQSATDPGSPKWDAVIQRLIPMGDVNLDGVVDAKDLAILETNYGLSGKIYWQEGDLNGDGTVNAADFALLEQNSSAAVAQQAQAFLAATPIPQLLNLNQNVAVIGTPGYYPESDGSEDPIANVFDGDLTTFFDAPSSGAALTSGQSPSPSTNDEVGLDLGSAANITAIRFAPRVGYETRMIGGVFLASNSADFSNPVTLYTITAAPPDAYTTVEVSAPSSYRYVMYVAPANGYGNIAEMQIYGEPAAPTMAVSAPGSIYTGQTIAATATVDGVTSLDNVSPTFLYYTGSTVNGTGTSTAPTTVGTYTVVASFAGSAHYSSASASTTFSITQATPTVGVTDGGGTYTGNPFPATATVTGVNGTPGASLENVTPSLLYYTGSSVSGASTATAPSAVGTYTVAATFGGSTDYTSNSASITFSISKAAATTPTVVATEAGGTFTGQPFVATATVNGSSSLEGVSPTFSYYIGSTVSGTSTSTPPTQVGKYTVVANFAGSADYNPASSSPVPFTIAQATPSVSVTDAGGTYTGSAYSATAMVAGVTKTPAASLESVTPTLLYYTGSTATGTSTSTAPTTAGKYTVVASFAGSTDYTAASSSPLPFTIAQATPTLTLTDVSGAYSGSGFPATVMVTGVSNAPGPNLESVTPTLLYYTGSSASGTSTTTAPIAAGKYTVAANFAGSTDYTAASPVQVTFTIAQVTPTVSVTDNGGIYSGNAYPATETVTGLSGTPAASLESVTPTLLYSNGSGTSTATAPSAVGAYTVVASFAGSTDYTAASSSTTFNITNAATTPVFLTPTSTTASTSVVYTPGPAEPYSNVFDGNTNTFWDSANASGNWVQEQFSKPASISSISFAPRQGFEYRMEGGVFEASNDPNFGTFVTLYTVPSTAPNFALDSVSVSASGTYQYVRYVAPSGSYGNIAEMQVYGILSSGTAPTVTTAPAATVSAAGTSAALSVAATETGNPSLTYTWSVVTLPSGVTATPTFSATNGKTTGNAVTVSFPAGDIAGTYGLQVTITDPSGNSTVSPLSVVVGQVLTSIAITPSATTVSVPASGTQTFTASGLDQFGVTMATQPTVTWSLAANSTGTIGSSSGLYTSSATVGATASVVATATGTNGTVTASQAVKTTAASTAPALLIPTTTTASTSAVYTPGPAEPYSNVFDGSTNTFWDSANASGNWVQEQFSKPATISSISFAPRQGYEYRMEGGVFEASNDPNFGTFVTLYTVPSTAPNFALDSVPVSVSGTYQYVRYIAPSGSYGNIAEMQVYGVLSSGTAPTVTTAPAATVSAAGTSAALSVAATETGNPSLTYTWSVVTMPSGVTATPTFSATNGSTTGNAVTASFPAGDIAGTYGLQVTITDPSGNSTVSPLSVVVGQVLTSIAITPSATTVSVPASGTQTFTASGLDQFGVTMATQPTVTWSLAANSTGTIGSSSGLYTSSATVGATASVVATATGTNGTVTASQAVKTTAASTAPALLIPTTTTASTSAVYTPGPAEPYSNVFDGSTNTFWDSANASGNWVQEQFSKPATISSISFAPRQGYEYRMEGGVFEASNDPNFGTFVTLYTVPSTAPNFALDSVPVSVSGTYQYVRYIAPSGSYGNIAEMQVYGVLSSGTAPTVTTAPAATVSAAGTSAALSVAATETGNPSLTYTWSVVTMPSGVTATPTFSATNGSTTGNAVTASFPAGDIAGTYGLQVTITDPSGNSTVSPLSVVVGQVLTSIAITPSATTVSVPASGTQTFTASGLDQFGVTMATQPTVTWSLAANSTGTIGSSSGLYTSSATVGATASVVATATGTNGTVTASQAVKTTAASTAPALLIPTTTTASTSAVYTPGPAEPYSNVFDGSTNTFWDSANASGNWVQENFGSAKTITSIAFAPRAGFEYRMEGGYFEASNDPNFGTAVILYTVPTTSQPGDSLTTQTISVSGTYQYVRYVAPSGSYGNIAEMQVFGY